MIFKFINSRKLILNFLVLLLCVPLLFINLRHSHDWGDDFAQYIHQAKNITEGIPQSQTAYVYSPANAVLGPPAYLTGFPLLLAPIYYFFGNNIMAFVSFINICLVVLAFLIFKYFQEKFSSFTALFLVIIIVYNPWVLNFKAEVMSEIPFTLLLFIILLFYEKSTTTFSVFRHLIIGFSCGFLISVRPAGIVVLITVFIIAIKYFVQSLTIGDRKKGVLILVYNALCILTAMGVFLILNKVVFNIPSGAVLSYSEIFTIKALFVTISLNFSGYFGVIMSFFSTENYMLNFLSVFTGAAFLVLSVTGWVRKFYEGRGFSEILFLIFFVLLLVYPYSRAGIRFIFPIIPFMIYYAVVAGKELLRFLPLNKNVVIAFLSLMVFMQYKGGISNVLKAEEPVWGPQHYKSVEAFDFIKNFVPEDAVIEFEKPRALALYTGRKGFHVNNMLEVEEIKNELKKAGVSYILNTDMPIEKYPVNNFRLYVLENARELKTIWTNEKFILYKLMSDSLEAQDGYLSLKQKAPVFEAELTFETPAEVGWKNIFITDDGAFAGEKSGFVGGDITYGPTYSTSQLPVLKQKDCLLYFESYFYNETIEDVYVVVSIYENKQNAYYKSYNLKDILRKTSEWEKVVLLFELPRVESHDYEFFIYLWNTGNSRLFVDNFCIKIY